MTTGTREQWLQARLELFKAEKEFKRRNDELANKRQQMPWVQSPRYMHVPNCAGTPTIGKLGRCRVRNKGVRGKFEGLSRTYVFAEGRVA